MILFCTTKNTISLPDTTPRKYKGGASQMHTFAIQEKNVTIFPSASPQAPIIYLNTFSNEGAEVFEAIQAASSSPFHLAVISNLRWNHDMAPWGQPARF